MAKKKFINLYETLEINESASKDEIEKQLNALEKRFRPLQGTASTKETRRKAEDMIDEWLPAAREKLLDPEKRKSYDAELAEWRAKQKKPGKTKQASYDWKSQAQKELERGDIKSARSSAQKYVDLDPTNLDALFFKAEVELKAGDKESASRWISMAADQHPNDFDVLKQCTTLFYNAGCLADTERVGRTALQLREKDRQLLELVYRSMLWQHKLQEAYSYVDAWRKRNAPDVDTLFYLADKCLELKHETVAAVRWVELACEEYPDDYDVLKRAETYLTTQVHPYNYYHARDAVERICRAAFELRPTEYDSIVSLFIALTRNEKHDEAYSFLSDCVEKNPDNIELKNFYAEKLLEEVNVNWRELSDSDNELFITNFNEVGFARNRLNKLNTLDNLNDDLKKSVKKLQADILYVEHAKSSNDFQSKFVGVLFTVVVGFVTFGVVYVGQILLNIPLGILHIFIRSIPVITNDTRFVLPTLAVVIVCSLWLIMSLGTPSDDDFPVKKE